RLVMWRHLVTQIPDYLIIGKGYSHNAADVALMRSVSGVDADYEATEATGNYHNGPLSVILPFGIFGSIAFLWLITAGWRVLLNNYHFGDPDCQRINTFLLAYFVGKIVLFFF